MSAEEFFEKFKDKHLVSKEAVETMLRLEGYGEDGTESLMDRIQLIAEMAPTEIIKKVGELRLYTGEPDDSDIGKSVAIRDRTIAGTLTDILDLLKNGDYCIAIDGKIYKMDAWDLIIVDEPSMAMASEPEQMAYPEGMDRVESITQSGECVVVSLVNGLSFCSHLEFSESLQDNILSLRRWEDREQAFHNVFVEKEPKSPTVRRVPVNMNWIKQIEAIHTIPDGLKCTHVEFKNSSHICSNNRHTTLGSIDSPSLREE